MSVLWLADQELRLLKCPTECEDSCNEVCHEVHWVEMKREHEFADCPGVLASIADLYEE